MHRVSVVRRTTILIKIDGRSNLPGLIDRSIATVSKPAVCILSGDGGKCLYDGFLQCFMGSCLSTSQEGFQFGECLFNR